MSRVTIQVVRLIAAALPACSLTAPSIEDLVGGAPPAPATTAGQGGSAAAICGDGVLDANEECDLGPDGGSGRCVDCRVECPSPEVEDPKTHHCYELRPASGTCGGAGCLSWDKADEECKPGRHLLILTSLDEKEFLSKNLGSFNKSPWTAAKDEHSEGVFHWEDFPEIPFPTDSWVILQADGGTQENCLVLGANLGFEDVPCGGVQSYVCEWDPAGPG